jgi:hypothetical protein
MDGKTATRPLPVIQSDVREVLVPVIVTDGNGQYVRTLCRDDFQVFENGKPVPSSSEAKGDQGRSGGHGTSAEAGTLNDAPKRTYLVLLIRCTSVSVTLRKHSRHWRTSFEVSSPAMLNYSPSSTTPDNNSGRSK